MSDSQTVSEADEARREPRELCSMCACFEDAAPGHKSPLTGSFYCAGCAPLHRTDGGGICMGCWTSTDTLVAKERI